MIRFRLRTVGLLAALASLLALSASWGFSHASAQGPAVSVGSLNARVGVLSKVEVSALAIGAPGLAAWTLDVQYDPALVTIVACAASQNGICNPHYSDTTVRVTGTNIYGLQGDTTLASIGLACKAAGTGHLGVSINVLADATIGGPRPIDAALQNGAVSCTTEAPPTPTSTPTHEPPPATATPPASLPKLPGDADCSGVVNPIDAELILQYVAHTISSLPCPDDADFNHDGVIDSIDAVLTLQKSAGLF
jgi:hypothetical protein